MLTARQCSVNDDYERVKPLIEFVLIDSEALLVQLNN